MQRWCLFFLFRKKEVAAMWTHLFPCLRAPGLSAHFLTLTLTLVQESKPCQFERCVLLSLQSLRGVLESKPGEPSVFQHPKTQEEVCQLSINIMQVFIHCLEQLSTKPDADVDTAHLSVDVSSPDLFGSIHEDFSLTSEQRLLIVLSNCCYLERHTFLNIADHFEKHNFQGIEKITQVMTCEGTGVLSPAYFQLFSPCRPTPLAPPSAPLTLTSRPLLTAHLELMLFSFSGAKSLQD
ncbi:EXOC2 [Cervus elaphus hippelaphus]|uniref:Exocyst complex component 2 n=1 Tax=Cervus elaphus hippelaphus TaxID=46360 RepID=A0A212D503_CEREH|nr:EXOC2 [Cervus elaphus hippelaphus]